jgi:hypothetical protein
MPRSLVEAFPGSLRKDIAEEEVWCSLGLSTNEVLS